MTQIQHALTNGGVGSLGALAQRNVETLGRRLRSLAYQIGRGFIGLLGVVVVLGLSGAVYESVAEAADERVHPPPGQMVDVAAIAFTSTALARAAPP